ALPLQRRQRRVRRGRERALGPLPRPPRRRPRPPDRRPPRPLGLRLPRLLPRRGRTPPRARAVRRRPEASGGLKHVGDVGPRGGLARICRPLPPAPMTPLAPGTLLVAEPPMPDPNFRRTVVLLCDHTTEGSFGLVLNRPCDFRL